jgi:hypothetical protein
MVHYRRVGSFLRRVSLIASFGAVLLVLLTIIDAGAVPYGVTDDFSPHGVTGDFSPSGGSQYGEAPQYGPVAGQIMMASYYGYSHAGNMTASGELFDPQGYTAAHRTMPFGTRLLVSHGGSSVVVTVNDRGPYVDGIDVDLSQAAADTIGLIPLGVAPVEATVL